MTRAPRSVEVIRALEDSDSVRRLDCANYNACLEHADDQRWPSFACGAGCYQPIDAAQRGRDFAGLVLVAKLIETI